MSNVCCHCFACFCLYLFFVERTFILHIERFFINKCCRELICKSINVKAKENIQSCLTDFLSHTDILFKE